MLEITLFIAFNFLQPLDLKCLGPYQMDGKPNVECYEYDVGVVEYDVRLG